jgi:PAS domain-containing protein
MNLISGILYMNLTKVSQHVGSHLGGKLIFYLLHRLIKIIAVSAEITNRKSAEHALKPREYMMRKIIETIPVGLWAADETTQICLANTEVLRLGEEVNMFNRNITVYIKAVGKFW